MAFDSYEDRAARTSLFKDALGQIRRLDMAWVRATRHRENGNLDGWRWILDTVYLELSYDVTRLSKDGLDYKNKIDRINDNISKAFQNKNNKEQYNLLKEKERILREVQEMAGKGAKMVDQEESFI